jgi:hypothetical protein
MRSHPQGATEMAFITYEHSPKIARTRDVLAMAIRCSRQTLKWTLIVAALPFLIVLGVIVALVHPGAIERY